MLLVVGYWLLVIGYWLLVVGCWLLVVGCWLLVIGYWLLVIGYWLLVVGYWLLVIGVLPSYQVRLSCRAFPCALRRRGVSTLTAARGLDAFGDAVSAVRWAGFPRSLELPNPKGVSALVGYWLLPKLIVVNCTLYIINFFPLPTAQSPLPNEETKPKSQSSAITVLQF